MKRFQGSTFDVFSRRKLVEDRDTILELTGKIQELQNKVNCLKDSRDFKDAESVRSGQSLVTSQPAFFPPFQDPGGMQSRSLWECRAATTGRQVFGTRMVYRETFFANPTASSSAPYPGGFDPGISDVTEHTSPHVTSECQTPALDQRCQSRPAARNSFVPCEGIFSKNYGADEQRLQISRILILTNSHRQQHSLVGRKNSRLKYVLARNSLRKPCCGSKKWSG